MADRKTQSVDGRPCDTFTSARTEGTRFAENLLAETTHKRGPNGERLMLTPPPIRRPERVYAVQSRNNIDFDYSSGEVQAEAALEIAGEE